MENRIRVGVNIRPLVKRELEEGAETVISADGSSVNIRIPNRSSKNKFDFDWAFDGHNTPADIYATVAAPLIQNIFEGFNATIFAYGQTGSGKTYTMGGSGTNNVGVVPQALQDIFKKRDLLIDSGSVCEITMSFMEIYMEDCYDLLASGEHRVKKLELRENSKGETFLEGLSNVRVANLSEAQKYLTGAAETRSTGKTDMNSQSSRSHSICTIYLKTSRENQGKLSSFISKLHLVDLAGSERAKKTMATGEMFGQGVNINKGLLALGKVVSALATKSKQQQSTKLQDAAEDKENQPINSTSNIPANNHAVKKGTTGLTSSTSSHIHVPYRESKLTRLLKDALGGNGITVLLACVSPADTNVDETIDTLRFASRALSIITTAHVNECEDDSTNAGTKEEIVGLKKELLAMRQQLQATQTRCNLLLAQQRDHQQQQRTLSAMPPPNRDQDKPGKSFAALAAGTSALASSVKSLLTRSFDEGLTVQDDEVALMISQIAQLQQAIPSRKEHALKLICPSDAFSMDLPPILNLIDAISDLESALSEEVAKAATSHALSSGACLAAGASYCDGAEQLDSDVQNTSGSCDDSADLSQDLSTSDLDPEDLGLDSSLVAPDDAEVENIRVCATKEAEVAEMLALTEAFHDAIGTLKEEIHQLEQEKERLTRIQASTSHAVPHGLKNPAAAAISGNQSGGHQPNKGAPTAEDSRLRQELRDKARLLEEKQQLLRSKEAEYSRVKLQKDKATKELESLRTELEEAKRIRVELAKKRREEVALHQAEKRQLQHGEQQSRRRELITQESLARLGNTLAKKEKVWKGQLAAKERETKQLRELVDKQQKVQAHREAFRKPTGGPMGSSSVLGKRLVGPGGAGEEPSQQRAGELKLWIKNERDMQVSRCLLEDELKAEVQRQLQSASAIAGPFSTNGGGGGDTDAADPPSNATDQSQTEGEIKTLEDEVRSRSVIISRLNGQLSDLGVAPSDRRRFAEVSDLREAKVVMGWLFAELTQGHVAMKRAMEVKFSHQESLLGKLRQRLDREEQKAKKFEAAAALAAATAPLMAGQKRVRIDVDAKDAAGAGGGSRRRAKQRRASDDSSVGSDYGEDLDESFRPDDEQDDDDSDSDYERPSRAGRNTRARPALNNRKRGGRGQRLASAAVVNSDGNASDSDDAAFDDSRDPESSLEELPKKQRKPATASAKCKPQTIVQQHIDVQELGIDKPLTDYTVKDLKSLLSKCGLTVSGVKDALVKRLEDFLEGLKHRAEQIEPAGKEDVVFAIGGPVDADSAPSPVDASDNDTADAMESSSDVSCDYKSFDLNLSQNSSSAISEFKCVSGIMSMEARISDEELALGLAVDDDEDEISSDGESEDESFHSCDS